jgi:hypothetical protein
MDSAAKLPVWRSFTYSYGFVWRHRRDLVRVGWLPLLLVFAVGLYFGSFDAMAPVGEDPAGSVPVIVNGLLGGLIQGAISVIVLVAWHRLVMRDYKGTETGGAQAGGKPGWRESLYFLQMLLLSLLFLIVWFSAFMLAEFVLIFGYLIAGGAGTIKMATADPTAVGQDPAFVVLGFLAVVIGLLPAFYVALRLSLVLPATATESDRGRLGQSWAASAGNGWRMVFATILVMLPMEIFNLGAGYLASQNAGTALHYPLVLLASIGLVVLMAVLGTILSRCYALLQYRSAEIADPGMAPVAG